MKCKVDVTTATLTSPRPPHVDIGGFLKTNISHKDTNLCLFNPIFNPIMYVSHKTLIYRTSPPTFCKFVSGHNNFDISFHLPPRRAARRHLARHRRTPPPQIKIKARNVPCCDCGDMEATEAANVVDEDEDGIGDEDEDDAAMATQARR